MSVNTESKLRDELELKFLFLHFVYVVAPGALYDDDFRRTLEETKEFIYGTFSEDFLVRVDEVSKRLDELVSKNTGRVTLKTSKEEIAREFGKLLNEQGDDIYLTGVDFGWLNRLIDCSSIGLAKDLPRQARVGLSTHASYSNVEERFLLLDAFFLLEVADYCYEKMLQAASEFASIGLADKNSYLTLSAANQNVCSAARLSIFSFYAFVEAFVNSIGSDFAARNASNLTQKEIEILHGQKQQRYLSLERKMESFPRITRQDKQGPIVLTDKKQQREPFLTFFAAIKEVRNASTHFGVGKANIWRKPEDWLRFAELTSRNSVEVASVFWEACYPGQHKPDYLLRLKYDTLRGLARDRLETTKHILLSDK